MRSIGEETDASEQAKKLNAFIAERFQTSMAAKGGELSDALRRYSLHSMQKYRTRYFLAKVTQYVEMAFKGMSSPGRLTEYTVLEIEHILPDTPEAALWPALQPRIQEQRMTNARIALEI